MPHFMILVIIYINLLKSVLDEKMSILRDMLAFKQKFCDSQILIIMKFVVVSSVGLKRAVCT